MQNRGLKNQKCTKILKYCAKLHISRGKTSNAKKWKMLAKMTDNDEDYNKYMNVSNTLMEMFTKEIQDMKI